jgi:hypothetical protein
LAGEGNRYHAPTLQAIDSLRRSYSRFLVLQGHSNSADEEWVAFSIGSFERAFTHHDRAIQRKFKSKKENGSIVDQDAFSEEADDDQILSRPAVSEPLDGGRIVFSPDRPTSSMDKTNGEKNKAERRKRMDARDSKMRDHGTISLGEDFRKTKTRETSSAWLLTNR